MTTVRFGNRVQTSEGEAVTLLGAHKSERGARAFVRHDSPVERCVRMKDGTEHPIGLGDHTWCDAFDAEIVCDKDGVMLGLSWKT